MALSIKQEISTILLCLSYTLCPMSPFDKDKKLMVVFTVWRNTLPLGKN